MPRGPALVRLPPGLGRVAGAVEEIGEELCAVEKLLAELQIFVYLLPPFLPSHESLSGLIKQIQLLNLGHAPLLHKLHKNPRVGAVGLPVPVPRGPAAHAYGSLRVIFVGGE